MIVNTRHAWSVFVFGNAAKPHFQTSFLTQQPDVLLKWKQRVFSTPKPNSWPLFYFSWSRKISSRIYWLMFTFEFLLQVWDAKTSKLISGHKVKRQEVCNYIQTSILQLWTSGQMDWKPFSSTMIKDTGLLPARDEFRGLVRSESLWLPQLFGQTIFFCLPFPGPKASPRCWPQWSALH